MEPIITALLLTLAAGAATGLGGALILFRKKLGSDFLAGALGLSAGVMIFISLAELYPEAQAAIPEDAGNGSVFVVLAFFLGMGIITLIDFLIPEYENPHEASGLTLDSRNAATEMIRQSEHEGRNALKKLGIMSALAIAIHNFPEGMATFIGTLNDPRMGTGITFAIAVHNIPEGIAVAIPIFYATRSKAKALMYATLSGLTEPAGAAICYGLTALFGIQIQGGGAAFPLILSAVAGIMVYISLDELLPTAEKYGKHHIAIAGVVSGMAIMAVSLLLL